MDYGRINRTEGVQARMRMELERKDEIDALLAYINTKIEYELAMRIDSHEHHYHDADESSCRHEREAMEAAERRLRELY